MLMVAGSAGPPGPDVREELQRVQTNLTRVLVGVGLGAMAFTATNVTLFAIREGVSDYIAWALDPMVGVALGAVLIADGVLAQHSIRPGGWATALRWFAGAATWFMNCWASLWPTGTRFGVPSHLIPAGLLLHSVPPVLLVGLAEAITVYRRAILTRIAELETPAVAVVDAPAVSPQSTPLPQVARPDVAVEAPAISLLVICGGQRLYDLVVPALEAEAPEPERLSKEDADAVIEQGWLDGRSVRETALDATRSPAYVGRVYQALKAAAASADSAPIPGQLVLVGGAS